MQEGDSLTGSFHTSLVNIEMVAFCIRSLSVQSVVNIWICVLYHLTLVQFHSSMWSGPVGSHRTDSTLLQGIKQQLAISSMTKQQLAISSMTKLYKPGLPAPFQYPCPLAAGFQDSATIIPTIVFWPNEGRCTSTFCDIITEWICDVLVCYWITFYD